MRPTSCMTSMLRNNPLPSVFSEDDDQTGFEAVFKKIWQPMEEIEKLPPNHLDDFYRSRYRNHIEGHFPDLFKLIERRTVVGNDDEPDRGVRGHGGMGLPGRDAGALAKSTSGIVDWVDADQKIKTFIERFSAVPTTLDIMMAQEDLWVYETLLKVIRYTNDVGPDPTQFQEEAGKELSETAQPQSGPHQADPGDGHRQRRRPELGQLREGPVYPPQRERRQSGRPAPRSAAAGADAAWSGRGRFRAGEVQASLLSDRYVDDNGKPLADPAQQPYGEFRMMPIDLKVVIEQKEIPRLLAECANSAMRIDVAACGSSCRHRRPSI